MMHTQQKNRILRRRQVQDRFNIGRSTIYDWIGLGLFPKPIRLGPRVVGWVETELDNWEAARIAAREA